MMGIGFLELLVIVLVAVIVLGPAKAIDMARSAGKMLGEVRRSFTDLSSTLDPSGWDDSPEAANSRRQRAPDPDGKAQDGKAQD